MKTLAHIDDSISRFRQLEQHIDAVRQDFPSVVEGGAPCLPSEVTDFHLRRETMMLGRQIREAVTLAWGEHCKQYKALQLLQCQTANYPSLSDYMRFVNEVNFDLQQERLHVLHEDGSEPIPGMDPCTDLYTAAMMARYLQHEVAWAQRCGGHFGVILLRIKDWPCTKRDYAATVVEEIMIAMACAMKTALRAHDFPCRLNECEFAAILREADSVTANLVIARLEQKIQAILHDVLPGTSLQIEHAAVIYPFDGETVVDLLSKATNCCSVS